MSVPFEQSRALGALNNVRHGFFGRRGGISTGDWASLNVSAASGDKPDYVAENRAMTAAALGFAPQALFNLKQTHSAIVHTITSPPDTGQHPEGDAIVTDVPSLLLGILTADCAPVLLADPAAGIVGAFHAGWRGAVDGIGYNTVLAMVGLGADPGRIVAAVGPTISLRNYEVGPEFAQNVIARHRDAENRIAIGESGREHFDLPGFVFDQLHGAGVGLVQDLAICTYAEPRKYFSHRYATHRGINAGRQIALIGIG
jgi:YfiH family protein